MNDATMIDHTLLAPAATAEQVSTLCSEAAENGFLTVCVSPTRVAQAVRELADHPTLVCTVVGFPSGAQLPSVKAAETSAAVAEGADEIDMVISLGAVKDGAWDLVHEDIAAVVGASGDALVKVILETALLTDDEIRAACEASEQAGADFVKTSTGFATGGATVEAVTLMRAAVGDRLGVKASGGIRTAETFRAMVDAGATRIGASAGATLLGR